MLKPLRADAGEDLKGIVPMYFEVTFLSNSRQNKQVPSTSGPITMISFQPSGSMLSPKSTEDAFSTNLTPVEWSGQYQFGFLIK